MRTIAVAYKEGLVGSVCQPKPQFKIYNFKGDILSGIQVLNPDAADDEAVYAFLKSHGVKVLICDDIMPLFAHMLESRLHIEVYSGVSGDCDSAAVGYIAGTLDFEPNMHTANFEHYHDISGHGHEHSYD